MKMKKNTCTERVPRRLVSSKVTRVGLDQIDCSNESGTARPGPLDPQWLKELRTRRKNVGELDPVLLWRNPDDPDAKLIILDGRHRIALQEIDAPVSMIRAKVLDCPWKDALLISGAQHVNSSLPLTAGQRADFAWRLTREGGGRFVKREIAKASGVSIRTVGYMRSRLREITKMNTEITGHWWRDHKDREADDSFEPLSDQQREEAIKEVVAYLRDMLDHRKNRQKGLPLHDPSIVDSALVEALGDARIRNLYEYSYGGLIDEETAAGLPVPRYSLLAVSECDEGDF